jgi:hypothetical protein
VPAVHVVETIESAGDRHFYALARDFLPARYFRGARSYHVNRSSGFAREVAERLGLRAPRPSVF